MLQSVFNNIKESLNQVLRYCFSISKISFLNFFGFKLIQIVILALLIANMFEGGKTGAFFLLFLVLNIPLSFLLFLITKHFVKTRFIGFLIIEVFSYFIIVVPIEGIEIVFSSLTYLYWIATLVGFIINMVFYLLMDE